MVYCANCGREISEQAASCPQCGHPNERSLGSPPAIAPYAGFWIRFASALIDGVILAVAAALLGGGFVVRTRIDPVTPLGRRPFFRPRFTGARLAGLAYHWLMLGLNDGRTVGCLATGIRVARPDGSRIGLGTAAARTAMAIVSAIPLGLGYFWMLWDPEKRTWHDIVANTRVFRVH